MLKSTHPTALTGYEINRMSSESDAHTGLTPAMVSRLGFNKEFKSIAIALTKSF